MLSRRESTDNRTRDVDGVTIDHHTTKRQNLSITETPKFVTPFVKRASQPT